jgi:PAS domain S-box-containing protein
MRAVPIHRLRLSARVIFLACVLIVVGAVVLFVIRLNDRVNRYGAARQAASVLLADTARVQGLAWQLAAERAPDFTVGQDLARLSADIRRQRATLHRVVPHERGLPRLDLLARTFTRDVAQEERLAATKPDLIDAYNLTYVDGSAELLQAELATQHAAFGSAAAAASRGLFRGTLGAVAIAGLLLTLVFLAIDRGRGRARAAERRFVALVERSNDVIAVVRPGGDIAYVTDSLATLTGMAPEEVVGRDFTQLLLEDERPAARMRFAAILAGGGGIDSDWSLRHSDGHVVTAQVSARDLTGDAAVGGVVLTLHDVTERRRIEDELRHRAFDDPLTGLANRALFEDRAAQALAARAAPSAWRSLTSTTSRPSTTRSVTRPATICSSRSPAASPASCAPATPRRASGAMSSPSCWRTSTPAGPRRSRSGCAAR